MLALRLLLVLTFTAIAACTVVVFANQGPNLLPVFFGDMLRMGWSGQFNLDCSVEPTRP